MSQSDRSKGLGAAARVTALAGSVMDLHVRIALQEMDREKRRLISGGLFLAIGGALMFISLIAIEVVLFLLIENLLNLNIQWSLVIISSINLFLAGISLRFGGHLLKGPYLSETIEGISKTTKAVLGRQ